MNNDDVDAKKKVKVKDSRMYQPALLYICTFTEQHTFLTF